MQALTGDMDLVKRMNTGLILDTLKHRGTLSRAALSRETGLSRSTCSILVDELLSKNLVVEKGKDASSGGRKPMLIDLNYDAGKAIGVKVMHDQVVGALVDLRGTPVVESRMDVELGSPVETYVRAIGDLVDELLPRAAAEGHEVIGVGIGMGGRIDYREGILLESSILGWHRVPLVEMLEERLSLPIYLENDVNTLAIGERHFGRGKEFGSFACISIGQGIGAGFITGGRLLKGSHHGAGELGHTKVVASGDGIRCSCGERGCLEAYASTPAILARLLEETGRTYTAEDISRLAASGDSAVLDALHAAGHYLGVGIANVINLFDPEAILLGGEGTAYAEYLLAALTEAVVANTVYELAADIPIVTLEYSQDMWVRGLATIVMMEQLQLTFEAF